MREEILKNIEFMLNKITNRSQHISEDMFLYGIAENKVDVCSLELAFWFVEIEAYYDFELPMDILRVCDIIDRAVSEASEDK